MKKGKLLNKTIWQWKVMEYIVCVNLILTPLFFNSKYQLSVFNTPKMMIIIGFILLATIFYLWGLLSENKINFRITPLHIISLLFLLIITISSLFGIDLHNSFFGTWRVGVNLILIYSLIFFSFLISFIIRKNKSFLPLILIFSFITSIIISIISYTGDLLFREATTIGNTSYTGAYLLFNFCFGLGLLFYYSKIWKKILIIFGLLLIVLSPLFLNQDVLLGKISFMEIIDKPFILFGQANAAVIGLGFSLLIISIFFLIFSAKKLLKTIGVILLIFILSITFYTGLQLVKPNTFINNTYIEAKGNNRLVTWDVAKVSFISHPFLGSGFNNFSYDYQKYFSPEILKEENPEFYFNQPHNVIWEYASNNGVLGLLSFFSLLIFTFLALFISKEDDYKKERSIKIALIGALFGYFVQNLFGFDTPVTYLMLFFLIGIAMGLSNKEWIINVSEKYKNLLKIKAGILIAICLIGVVIFIVLPTKEFKQWKTSTSTNNIKERVFLREKMQNTSLFGGVFDSVYVGEKLSDSYNININKINDSNRNLYLKEIKSVIYQIEKDIEKQPNEIRAYIFLNQLLNMEIYIEKKVDEGIWNKSLEYGNIAIKLNPKNPETYLLLAQTYILKEDFKNVYFAIHKALEIGPKYKKSYDYANKILKIKPDADFQKFINEMMIKNDIKL